MGGRDAAGGSGPGVHGHGSSAQSTMSTAQQSGVQQLGRAGDMGLPAGVARHGGDQQRTTSSERSSHGTSAQGDAQVIIPAENSTADVEKGSGSGSSGAGARRSIYDLYTSRRRNTILLAAAFASILVPFCDTVYLPALAVSSRARCVGRVRGRRTSCNARALQPGALSAPAQCLNRCSLRRRALLAHNRSSRQT
jgi:hypothetical protein